MELNPYIAIPLVAWFLAQWIKFSLAAFKDDFNFRYLYASGGMPSVHSAVVTSLFVTTWILQGSNSPLAGITAILAAIVIYDSLGVRRSTGEQAIVLNALVDGLEEHKITFNNNVTKVREVLGHKPKEVFWGMVLGGLVAVVANLEKLDKQIDFLAAIPKGNELYGYVAVLGLLFVGVSAIIVAYRKRWTKTEGQTGKLLAWLTIAAILGGFFILLAAYEAVAVLGSRWPIYVLFALLAGMIFYIVRSLRQLPAVSKNDTADSKARWLEKSKKKKRKK
jgi:acid phosphatase family membrane protein YuiD